tara:strand:- start:910 stop:1587 length:678 start_codon:yes stop_codon:yes gene_type:complete
MSNLFSDRADAGRQLAAALPDLDAASTVVIALPRGGVPVAAEICSARHLEMDLVFVRKIGAPGHSELAIGAIVDGDDPQVVVNSEIAGELGVSIAEVQQLGIDKLPEIERRKSLYLAGRPSVPVAGKTLLMVDDGAATGASMSVAIQAYRHRGASRIIVALPVSPSDTLKRLKNEADECLCLYTPSPFYAVGAYYADFAQITDSEVADIMRALPVTQSQNASSGN